jgi:D-serine deaminase-like pyridoxal phosphate-dependent protein
VEASVLQANLDKMATALPGARMRPHVKAHKTTALAQRQRAAGHPGFTCATLRECEGMAAAGLGQDLLLANEVLDARRAGALVEAGHRVTVAVDSDETVAAAAAGGVREVLIDVNVGLPRCGCAPEDAGRLADLARSKGLEVRGVMGYEGHLMVVPRPYRQEPMLREAMELLLQASRDVGGGLVSGGGTGTWATNTYVDEIQAGSYVLMDSHYAAGGAPFGQALHVLASVISVNRAMGYAVADVGLKSLGMDHGLPSIEGATVHYCADEHTMFTLDDVRVGDRVKVVPAHVDPTVALHERMHLVRGDEVVESWAVDLRGW